MTTVLITGASSGIGLALCAVYRERGAQVIAACRKAGDDLRALGVEIVEGLDVTLPEAGTTLLQTLGGRDLDILINNAGVFGDSRLGTIDYEDVLRQFQVNALAPLRLTEALLPRLKSGAKVGMITSRMGSIADNGSGAYYAYRMSKAALNAAGVSLARDLAPRGVAVALLHPGFVRTRMVGFAGDIGPDESARRIAARLDALSLANSGGFWHSNGDELPW
ncbi:MAG: SDR family oxidoreductase [Rhodocyclaceae bacterium]